MSENARPTINMAHLEVIANCVNSNGRYYARREYKLYDVCAVRTKDGAIVFVVPIGTAPPEDTDKKPAEIEEIIRRNKIYSEMPY